MAMLSLFDLFTRNRTDVLTGLVEDVTTKAPEFMDIPTIPRPGVYYTIVRRTAYPTVAFRKLNAGVVPSKSAYKKEVKEMFYLDGIINVDEGVLKGDDGSPGDLWMQEADGVFRNALITIGAQVYYGTSADASGFAGVRSQLSGSTAAGGTTNSTSAYLLWMDPKHGVRFDVGKDGAVSVPPPQRQQISDPNDSTKNLFAWVSNLSCYIGLSVMSDKSCWAVTGVTTHQTSNVNDQAMSDFTAASLIANIPVARRDNLRWFMNRTAAATLQQSRSTINIPGGYSFQAAGSGGTPAWAPRPEFCEGYPISMTDSITNTESN